jgi:3-hydroxyethyl bacteriochlorophyllide a dehydrogenase
MPQAQAIVFEAPRELSVRRLELKPFEPADIEVEVSFSGISTGTERLLWEGSMPPFPGLGYPLVPGYETVGVVVKAGDAASSVAVGDYVFVPGSYSFQGVRNIFGGAGARLIVPHDRVVPVAPELGPQAILLALAATCHHALAPGGEGAPLAAPQLIVGHGVMGRLLARTAIALGQPAPTVWETRAERRTGATGYAVLDPAADPRRDYACVHDVSGDSSIIDTLIARLAPGGEVVLAGFYKDALGFSFAPAFMREARIRIAAQWKPFDLQSVAALTASGRLSLEGLITHTVDPSRAREAYEIAFGDPQCLKMLIDWRA